MCGYDAVEHIRDGHVSAATHLCRGLHLDPSELLTSDVKSHPEFLQALVSVAVSGRVLSPVFCLER